MEKKWIELNIICHRSLEDIVSNYLYELPITAVEIKDSDVINSSYENKLEWVIMDSSMCYESENIEIKTFLENNNDAKSNISKLEGVLKEISKENNRFLEFNYDKLIEDEDWSKEWKKHYDTIKIGESIIINPIWKKYKTKDDEIVINIDPGMAFGTGSHETTSLSLLALEKLELKNKILYDIGTGSGILSIAAAKFGVKKILAVDIDELCIEATNKNIILNDVDDIVTPILGNLDDKISKDMKADVIVANILYHIIVDLVPNLNNLLNKDGVFIASGIIKDKKQDLIEILNDNNFEITDILEKNDWVTLIVRNRNA